MVNQSNKCFEHIKSCYKPSIIYYSDRSEAATHNKLQLIQEYTSTSTLRVYLGCPKAPLYLPWKYTFVWNCSIGNLENLMFPKFILLVY